MPPVGQIYEKLALIQFLSSFSSFSQMNTLSAKINIYMYHCFKQDL
jgi:hypothetical protein